MGGCGHRHVRGGLVQSVCFGIWGGERWQGHGCPSLSPAPQLGLVPCQVLMPLSLRTQAPGVCGLAPAPSSLGLPLGLCQSSLPLPGSSFPCLPGKPLVTLRDREPCLCPTPPSHLALCRLLRQGPSLRDPPAFPLGSGSPPHISRFSRCSPKPPAPGDKGKIKRKMCLSGCSLRLWAQHTWKGNPVFSPSNPNHTSTAKSGLEEVFWGV